MAKWAFAITWRPSYVEIFPTRSTVHQIKRNLAGMVPTFIYSWWEHITKQYRQTGGCGVVYLIHPPPTEVIDNPKGDRSVERGSSWSWSCCSWIYNYLSNQCLSPLAFWVRIPLMARCTRYIVCQWLATVDDFDRVLWFPPPIKLTTTI